MLFVVDIGNSHTVTGVYDNDQLLGQWRLTSDKNRTSDEIGMRYRTLLPLSGIDTDSISHIIISSVVPSLEAAWLNCCKKYFSLVPEKNIFTVSLESVADLIEVQTENPSEVGADRLVNGIAAWYQEKRNVIVIDFGTAITFDCVSKACQYLGGVILPGVNLSLDALSTKTAKLPHIDISIPPAKVVGTNTVSAMKSGMLYGYGSLIDGLVNRIKLELFWEGEDDFTVIATGGVAELMSPYSNAIERVEPLLTLQGLQIIYNKLSG